MSAKAATPEKVAPETAKPDEVDKQHKQPGMEVDMVRHESMHA